MKPQIDGQAYQALFIANTTGQKVLEDLTSRFYDIESYTRGDQHETSRKEGQRSVIRYVLAKLAQLPNEGEQE